MTRIIFLVMLLCLFFENVNSETIFIEDLSKVDLKEIIQNSNPYDTIQINSGKYKGESILIDKPLIIIGKNDPVIEGLGTNHIILFRANDIIMQGMRIINTGYSYVQDRAAIRADSTDNCILMDNKFENCMFGVYSSKVSNIKILNNTFVGENEGEAASGNAVHFWHCKGVEVNHNTMTGHRDGIYLEFTQDAKIDSNYSYKNIRYGLHFMFSHNAEYINNRFIGNGSGVAVMYTHNVIMENNLFEGNLGSAAYALLLKDIKDSKVINNRIINNSTGMFIDGGGQNIIKNNLIMKNAWAIRIYTNSSDNTIEGNNIMANTFDVATNSSFNTNKFIGNYWDKYRGYDYDRDGVGDIPYYPVRLFSYLVEKNPPFIILMHSFFIFVLDMAENIMPSLVPDSIVDVSPMMVPVQ